jgi:hypothetical protein
MKSCFIAYNKRKTTSHKVINGQSREERGVSRLQTTLLAARAKFLGKRLRLILKVFLTDLM